MSKIEAKRKELEDEVNSIYISGKTDGHKSRKLRNRKAELKGFNCGVEMARKEFAVWLNNIMSESKDAVYELCKIEIKELIKSLEAKE